MQVIKSSWSNLKNFCLFNIPLFIISLGFFAKNQTILQYPLALAYFILLTIAQAGVFAWLFCFLLPTLLYYMGLRKISLRFWASLISSLSLFALFIDALTYQFTHSHINSSLLAMIVNPASVEMFMPRPLELLSLILLLLALFLLEWFLFKCSMWIKAKWPALLVNFGLIIALVFSQAIYAWADAAYEQRILLTTELSPAFFGMTAKRFLARHHWVFPNSKAPKINNALITKLHYPRKALQVSAPAKKTNILFIVIDAWRYDSFSKLHSPNVYGFSQQATIYQNHYSGGNCTRAGIFSLLYSVSPNDFDSFYRAGRGPLLFDLLYQENYQVAAFPSASAVSPPFHRTAFVNLKNFQAELPGNSAVERDREVTNQTLAFIKKASKANQPFFAFAFYDSVHAYDFPKTSFTPPFKPSAPVVHLKLGQEADQQLYKNQYYNALYYVDGLIAELIEQLHKLGNFDDTLIIVTADHGEEFNDNGLGFWGHNGNFTPAQTHVPLLIHWPNQNKPKEITYTSSHYDVVPSLMHSILGVSNPTSDYSLGYFLEDNRPRDIILMGSYGKTAFFAAEQGQIAVSNRFGIFHSEDLHGQLLADRSLSPELLKQALAQMGRFH